MHTMLGQRTRETGEAVDITIWQIVWSAVAVVLFAAYLALLFVVLSDMVRNTSLSGWSRVIWVILLVVFPFLASIAYLIAHGQTMALRNSRGRYTDPEPIRTSGTGSPDPVSRIAMADELLRSGTITGPEFEQLKRHALHQIEAEDGGQIQRAPAG